MAVRSNFIVTRHYVKIWPEFWTRDTAEECRRYVLKWCQDNCPTADIKLSLHGGLANPVTFRQQPYYEVRVKTEEEVALIRMKFS